MSVGRTGVRVFIGGGGAGVLLGRTGVRVFTFTGASVGAGTSVGSTGVSASAIAGVSVATGVSVSGAMVTVGTSVRVGGMDVLLGGLFCGFVAVALDAVAIMSITGI